MAKIGKKMQLADSKVNKLTAYPVEQAVELAKSNSITKFDGTLAVAIKLNLDTTKVEQQLRGSLALPKNTGKVVRVLALSDDMTEQEAKAAGADLVGGSDLISSLEKMINDFDVIITTPKMMPKLAKLGKILGPRGLMPNPKTGTVVADNAAMAKAIGEFKNGRSEYRTDSYGNIHMVVGKVSMNAADVAENINAVIAMVKAKKPSTVKGTYIQNIVVSPTMGPGVKIVIPQ